MVIPVYNAATTIERAVLSCLHQSVPPLEIILVNDASTDATADILDRWKEYDSIRVLNLSENKGVSYARNHGWRHATAPYIAFLDSDDEWHLEKMKYCMQKCIDQDLTMLWHQYQYEPISNSALQLPSTQTTNFSSLLIQSPIATCTIVVKRMVNTRFDERMRYCEDHDFLLRFAYEYDIQYLPMPLARVHRKINSPGGLSGQVWKMRKGEIYMYLKLPKLNPLFIFLTPFLICFSLLKHLRLLIRR